MSPAGMKSSLGRRAVLGGAAGEFYTPGGQRDIDEIVRRP